MLGPIDLRGCVFEVGREGCFIQTLKILQIKGKFFKLKKGLKNIFFVFVIIRDFFYFHLKRKIFKNWIFNNILQTHFHLDFQMAYWDWLVNVGDQS